MTTKFASAVLLLFILPLCQGLSESLFDPARLAQLNRIRILSSASSSDPIDVLANNNFKLLLDDSGSKQAAKPFFDFPEMKLLAQQKLGQDQEQIQDFVKSKEIKHKPNRVKLTFMRRSRKVRSLASIKLSAEAESLLPDLTETLEALKPRRRHRKLVVTSRSEDDLGDSAAGTGVKKSQLTATTACTEAEQLSGKCATMQVEEKSNKPQSGPRNLQRFEKYDQAFSKNVRISNQRVLAKYNQAIRSETESVEKNYQSFLIYATEKYMQIQAQMWLADQTAYNRAKARADTRNTRAISAAIKSMIKKLAKFHSKESQQNQSARQQELKNSLIDMQNKYNDAFIKDQMEANQIVNKLEDERLNEWKNSEKDKQFIDKQLLGSL